MWVIIWYVFNWSEREAKEEKKKGAAAGAARLGEEYNNSIGRPIWEECVASQGGFNKVRQNRQLIIIFFPFSS